MTNPTETPAQNPAPKPAPGTATGERADLLQSIRRHRGFLLHTVAGLDDEQARTRSTVSELTLGGLVKHVGLVERQWADFMVHGAANAPVVDWEAIDWSNPPAEVAAFADGHRLRPDETLAGAVEAFHAAAAATDALVETLDLDTVHDLPAVPWFEEEAWSVRRAVLQLIAEISQHSGHADIIREAIDGQKTMG